MNLPHQRDKSRKADLLRGFLLDLPHLSPLPCMRRLLAWGRHVAIPVRENQERRAPRSLSLAYPILLGQRPFVNSWLQEMKDAKDQKKVNGAMSSRGNWGPGPAERYSGPPLTTKLKKTPDVLNGKLSILGHWRDVQDDSCHFRHTPCSCFDLPEFDLPNAKPCLTSQPILRPAF
jgi:hypothetical protein